MMIAVIREHIERMINATIREVIEHRVEDSVRDFLAGKLSGLNLAKQILTGMEPPATKIAVVNGRIVSMNEMSDASKSRARFVLNSMKTMARNVVNSASERTPQCTYYRGHMIALDDVIESVLFPSYQV